MARQPWWPSTLPAQIQKVKDIEIKIAGHAAALGLMPAEVTDIENICIAIQGGQEFRVSTEGTSQAVTEWRDEVFYGTPKGNAVSAAPVFAVKGAVTYTRGSVDQLFDWRDNILTRPGFTDAIGEDTGFLGAEAGEPDAGQPGLKIEAAAQGGFAFGAVISNRGESDQWVLSGALVGTTNWEEVDVYTGKTANGTWPGGGTNPVQVQFRAQLRRKNENYGIPSDVVIVTLIP